MPNRISELSELASNMSIILSSLAHRSCASPARRNGVVVARGGEPEPGKALGPFEHFSLAAFPVQVPIISSG